MSNYAATNVELLATNREAAFSEILWFKKGVLDAAAAAAAATAAGAAAHAGGHADDQLTPDRYDSLPIEERYCTDITISADDVIAYGLGTCEVAAIASPASSADQPLVREMVREISGRGPRLAFAAGGLIASVALFVGISRYGADAMPSSQIAAAAAPSRSPTSAESVADADSTMPPAPSLLAAETGRDAATTRTEQNAPARQQRMAKKRTRKSTRSKSHTTTKRARKSTRTKRQTATKRARKSTRSKSQTATKRARKSTRSKSQTTTKRTRKSTRSKRQAATKRAKKNPRVAKKRAVTSTRGKNTTRTKPKPR